MFRTQLRSVIAYFREEAQLNKSKSSADHIVITPEEAIIEMEKCLEINKQWNANCEAIRNGRIKTEYEQDSKYIEKQLEQKMYADEDKLQKIEETVRREKKESKTYITAENLDQAIENALVNSVDVNFAIDLKQTIHDGRVGLKQENKLAVAGSS